MVVIIGLGGVTCGGNSTLLEPLAEQLRLDGVANIVSITQDKFYKEPSELQGFELPKLGHWDFDVVQSVHFDRLLVELNSAKETADVILVDGNLIFEDPDLDAQFDFRLFFTLDFEECKRRRLERDYEPPDVPGYFEDCVWPHYLEHYHKAKKRNDFIFIDGCLTAVEKCRQICSKVRRRLLTDWVLLVKEPLDSGAALDFVTSAECGAVSMFMGTTRDNFGGKKVIRLEYEAYEEMALKTMRQLCHTIRSKWPNIKRIAVFHRLGLVPVSEASVLLVVSSPHRADALEATQFGIDHLKSTVPIWKKEIYDDNSSEWKSNRECCLHAH